MKRKLILIVFLLIYFQTLSIHAQCNSIIKDSTNVSNIVSDFFYWYIKSAKEKRLSDIYPIFIESKNGMTTLDYTKYIENLAKHAFSEQLILAEIQSYKQCISNLEKVKYGDFKSDWIDLDIFESSDCDFSNNYRWTGGQEMCDGFCVKEVDIYPDSATVTGFLFFQDYQDKNKIYHFTDKRIALVHSDNLWKILYIK